MYLWLLCVGCQGRHMCHGVCMTVENPMEWVPSSHFYVGSLSWAWGLRLVQQVLCPLNHSASPKDDNCYKNETLLLLLLFIPTYVQWVHTLHIFCTVQSSYYHWANRFMHGRSMVWLGVQMLNGQDRWSSERKTMIYVYFERMCKTPQTSYTEACDSTGIMIAAGIT